MIFRQLQGNGHGELSVPDLLDAGAVVPPGQVRQNVQADAPLQLGNAALLPGVIRWGGVGLRHHQIVLPQPGLQPDERRGHLAAGLHGVVHQVAEQDHQVHVGNGQPPGQHHRCLHRDPGLPGLPDAAEQEGVHQGIFALAQLGAVLLLAHQFPGVGRGLLAAVTLQQQLDGVHMVGDVMADAAVVLVLIHQGGVVLQLVVQLVIQQAVGGFQLRLPGGLPDQAEQRHVGHGKQQDQNGHSRPVDGLRKLGIQPEHGDQADGLLQGENRENQPLGQAQRPAVPGEGPGGQGQDSGIHRNRQQSHRLRRRGVPIVDLSVQAKQHRENHRQHHLHHQERCLRQQGHKGRQGNRAAVQRQPQDQKQQRNGDQPQHRQPVQPIVDPQRHRRDHHRADQHGHPEAESGRQIFPQEQNPDCQQADVIDHGNRRAHKQIPLIQRVYIVAYAAYNCKNWKFMANNVEFCAFCSELCKFHEMGEILGYNGIKARRRHGAGESRRQEEGEKIHDKQADHSVH